MASEIKISIDANYPNKRVVRTLVDYLNNDMVMAHAGDCGMYLSCKIDSSKAHDKIRLLRNINDKHYMTLLCRDLSELGQFAKVSNSAFRSLKNNTPGLCTFVLEATKYSPRRIMHPKRKTIGLRIPQTPWLQSLLQELSSPLITVSLVSGESLESFFDYPSMLDSLKGRPDVVVDIGTTFFGQTTLVDLTGGSADIIRAGDGEFK